MAMGHATGEELDQRAIMDVLRTSEVLGTFSGDVVRGGQFSHMSEAQGRQFPEQAPTRGWDSKRWPDQLGLGAFGHRRMTCWLDELKTVIAQDIPAIILMEFGDVPFDGVSHAPRLRGGVVNVVLTASCVVSYECRALPGAGGVR
jgi:hypothetical protein